MRDLPDEENDIRSKNPSTPILLENPSGKQPIDTTEEEKHETDSELCKEIVQVQGDVKRVALEPALGVETLQRWNHPRINVWRTVVACYGLFIMGMNDATYGVCGPRIRWTIH